jgi:hypothetical protein
MIHDYKEIDHLTIAENIRKRCRAVTATIHNFDASAKARASTHFAA